MSQLYSNQNKLCGPCATQAGTILGTAGEQRGSMSPLRPMTDEQFERHALDVLLRELGVDGRARFLRLHHSGPGDYTNDRMQWQREVTVDEVPDSVERRRHG
jgi:hypothetical protein